MLGRLRHRLRSPASLTAAAIVTLVMAVGGFAAIAKKQDKDEVTMRTITGGPTQTTDPFEEVAIPLANATFVQRAGEAMIVMVRADFTPSPDTHFCDVAVFVSDANDAGAVGIFFEESAEKGDIGQATGSELMAAPAVDTTHTLQAVVVEDPADEPRCDGPDEDDQVVREDTWTVSLRVTVASLRN